MGNGLICQCAIVTMGQFFDLAARSAKHLSRSQSNTHNRPGLDPEPRITRPQTIRPRLVGRGGEKFSLRHCEKRSDEAIQMFSKY
ncbi:hypothetical protein MNBD_ALPHA11-1267 [hydrothermal vent metagenome]|uniref:Uncharacterized protein n=1 Tax=hydrothermal vent metagenome TaxID=652676 RepID=A0A3B0TUS2_9ZZZZ